MVDYAKMNAKINGFTDYLTKVIEFDASTTSTTQTVFDSTDENYYLIHSISVRASDIADVEISDGTSSHFGFSVPANDARYVEFGKTVIRKPEETLDLVVGTPNASDTATVHVKIYINYIQL